ncbi:hypothetical protein Tco_1574361, partial [Tanacetum coccineum]
MTGSDKGKSMMFVDNDKYWEIMVITDEIMEHAEKILECLRKKAYNETDVDVIENVKLARGEVIIIRSDDDEKNPVPPIFEKHSCILRLRAIQENRSKGKHIVSTTGGRLANNAKRVRSTAKVRECVVALRGYMADDFIVLCHGDGDSVNVIKHVLDEFNK